MENETFHNETPSQGVLPSASRTCRSHRRIFAGFPCLIRYHRSSPHIPGRLMVSMQHTKTRGCWMQQSNVGLLLKHQPQTTIQRDQTLPCSTCMEQAGCAIAVSRSTRAEAAGRYSRCAWMGPPPPVAGSRRWWRPFHRYSSNSTPAATTPFVPRAASARRSSTRRILPEIVFGSSANSSRLIRL